jgi:hypothetical protein
MRRMTPSAAQLILQEEQAFAMFRQRFQPADQTLLDELLYDLRLVTIKVQDAGHAPTFEGMLLTLLLVQYKDLKRLWEEVRELEWNAKATPLMPREAPLSRSRPVDPGVGFDDDPKI